VADNAIGSFEFLSLTGQVAPPSTRLELIQRPGIPGSGVRDLNYLSVPFKLRSIVDVASVWEGQILLVDYDAIKGTVVTLIKDGVDFSDPLQAGMIGPWSVLVLDVRLEALHATLAAVGGISLPSGAVLVCQWDLVAV
jgi:hypothetical protein